MVKNWVVVVAMVAWGIQVVSAAHWGYPPLNENGQLEGEDDWGGVCSEGLRQSPVDLAEDSSVEASLPSLLLINYKKALKNATVKNTGHSLQVDIDNAQKLLVTGGGLPGVFIADQLHLHWGAEHTVNGDRSALELHIVSHDVRHKSFAEAVKVKNGVAVLGVLFNTTVVVDNGLENILDSAESIKEEVGLASPLKRPLTVASLLPENLSSFYRYEGSLTTPTCDETVVWTVFTQTKRMTQSQILRLQEVKDGDGEELTHNYRPVKSLNGRKLLHVQGKRGEATLIN